MRLTRDDVLAALAGPRGHGLSEKGLLRVVGGRRSELAPLRLLLQRLMREGRVERSAGRYRLTAAARSVVASTAPRPRSATAPRLDDERRAKTGRSPRVARDGRPGAPCARQRDHVENAEADDASFVRVRSAAPSKTRPGRSASPPRPRREKVSAAERDSDARASDHAPRTRWVGVVERRAGRSALVPLRDETPWRIALPRHALGDAAPGDVVEVVFEAAGARRAVPHVARVFGRPGDPDADFEAVVWHRELRVEFPAEVLAEADAASELISAAERARRRDLTALPFVTIDPATARDHDDAVCIEALARGGVRLWVAIADVAAFVPERSALDREALRRGNSIYFPDRAIPMLPHRLSGDVCSLRPGVERLVRVVELELDRDATVRARRFHEAVIRSRARLVYEDAAAVMDGVGDGGVADPVVREQLVALRDVAASLMRRRREAGAIDFEIPAAEVVLGEDGRPTGMVASSRTVAHRAIEEAMLAANRAVAEALDAAGIGCIHRVHEPPEEAKLEILGDLLARFGLLGDAGSGDQDVQATSDDARGGSPARTRGKAANRRPAVALGAREIAAALRRAAGRPEERLVNLVALRSMKQARYVGASLGHFALAFDAYLHFTSPIRRYADLVAHRALRDLLQDDDPARARIAAREAQLARLGEQLSARERAAVEAEREMVDLKKCIHLLARVGEESGGVISGVAPHGLYVTLDDAFADGLVHVSQLPGYFDLDEHAHVFVERRGPRRFRLGDALRVRIESVDVARGRVRLALVEPGEGLNLRRTDSPADRGPRSPSRSRRPPRGSGGGRSRRRPASR